MRATSVFIFDAGMSTRRCFDPQALRMRVSMSAMGSVIDMITRPETGDERRECSESPGRLPDSRNLSFERELAKRHARDAERADEPARAAGHFAPVAHAV